MKWNIDGESRFELKYRLNAFQYFKMRNAIQPYMVMDPFTKFSEQERYLVRSLYFDTYNYYVYHQKINGDSERVKFRLRTYQSEFAETGAIRVELKMRKANRSVKKSEFVPMDEYLHFLKHRHWQSVETQITTEFERQRLIQDLRPIILVEYDREGYQSKASNDLRITFDHNLRSAHAKMLFPNQIFFQSLMPKTIVLEIKFRSDLPLWLERIVRQQGLKVIANSKYTQGLQIARHDLYYPDKVIIVR